MTAFDKPLVGDPLGNDSGAEWIRMVNHEIDVEPVGPVMSHWQVNPEGRAPWLQRWLFAALRRLGAQQQPWRQQEKTLKVVDLPPDSFLALLYESIHNVQQMFRHEPTVLYVGGRQYKQVMRLCSSNCADVAAQAPFWFNTSYRVSRHGHQELLGLKVNVVPWFDGVLAL